MFHIVKDILFALAGISAFIWLFAYNNAWRDLAELYRTENSKPNTFLIADNQRISFVRENKSGSLALVNLGIGVLDRGLYLTSSEIPFFSYIQPALLIPWSDINYRLIPSGNSSAEYYTFYLGDPRLARFSINSETIRKLERDYGEPIFLNKLGVPE